MKSFIIILFIVGIVMTTVGYMENYKNCPLPKVEYRYIPRTFEEEQENPVKVGKIFKALFEEPDIYLAGRHIGTDNLKKGQAA